MRAKVHNETELYRVESRSARKLVWIETLDLAAAHPWRVFKRELARDYLEASLAPRSLGSVRSPENKTTTESLAPSECPRSCEFRAATVRLGRCRDSTL